jgi:hypothetical protein
MTRLPGIDLGELELIEDVAPKLGIAKSTLTEWTRTGKFPSVKLPGARRVFIPKGWAEHYLATGCELVVDLRQDGGRVVRPLTYREPSTNRRR